MFPEPGDNDEWDRVLTPAEITNAKISMWALAAFVLILALYLPGCVSAPVAPNLKFPEQKACRSVALLPVPEKVTLIIDGSKIEADQGGEQLLRGYVASRYVFQSAGAK